MNTLVYYYELDNTVYIWGRVDSRKVCTCKQYWSYNRTRQLLRVYGLTDYASKIQLICFKKTLNIHNVKKKNNPSRIPYFSGNSDLQVNITKVQ